MYLVWFVFYSKCWKHIFLFKIEKCRLVFLSILKKKLSKCHFERNISDLYYICFFVFGTFHIKGNEKQIHAFAFAFILCAKNDLGKCISVRSLPFVWKNCNLLSLVARIFITQNKQWLFIIVDCIIRNFKSTSCGEPLKGKLLNKINSKINFNELNNTLEPNATHLEV